MGESPSMNVFRERLGCSPAITTRRSCTPRLTCHAKKSCSPEASRRELVLAAFSSVLLLNSLPAAAKPNTMNQEVDAATSPYIQDLLAKSEAKREERAKAMLQSYMKKNYKEYFEYETGRGASRGLSEESQAKIKQW